MNKKIKLGFSGLGRNFGRWIGKSPQEHLFTLKWGYDPRLNLPKESEKVLTDKKIKRVPSFKNLVCLVYQEKGALVINSPDNAHYRQTLDAIESETPLFVEKPMARTIDECNEIKNEIISKNIIYISGLKTVEFLQQKQMKKLFQEKFGKSNLEGWVVQAGYYHNLLPCFNELARQDSDFHLYQNYYLGGGIHALANVLDLTQSKVIDIEPVSHRGKVSSENPNPTSYQGKMRLSNNMLLILESDIDPKTNFFGHEDIESRIKNFFYMKILDKNKKVILEVRKENNMEILSFCGKDYPLKTDMLAQERLYQEFYSAICENRTPRVNNIDFTYNCTIPIIDSLNLAKIPRLNLENLSHSNKI